MTAQIIDGLLVADKVKAQIKSELEWIKQERNTFKPSLAVVMVGGDPASQVYVRKKQEACHDVGFFTYVHHLNELSSTQEIVETIKTVSEWSDGLIVQLPLPPAFNRYTILDAIPPSRDVDCLSSVNTGLVIQNRPRFLPCTPQGVVELLKHYNIETRGKRVAIINRSIIVGQPLASMLVSDNTFGNATVVVCHEHTQNLKEITLESDIIVVAVGKRPHFLITADMVKPGSVVIDVGINRVGRKILGDVDYEAVKEVAGWITPVPGGVGPMTVAMLLRNTLEAAKFNRGIYEG